MWSRLPKDITNLILAEAACDQGTIRAMSCVSKEWQQWVLFKAPLPLESKAGYCQFTRRFMTNYVATRNQKTLKRLWFSMFSDNVEAGLAALLQVTANHFKTFSYKTLPANGVLRSSLTAEKLACLEKMGPLELYLLYLVEQGFMFGNTEVEGCINELEKAITRNYFMARDKFTALQTLIGCANGLEKSVYLKVASMVRAESGVSRLSL